MKCNTHPVEINKSAIQKNELPRIAVKNFTFKQVKPEVRAKETQQNSLANLELAYVNVNASKLPSSIVSKICQLEASYREGSLTLDGLKWKKSKFIADFLHSAVDHHLVYHERSQWLADIKQIRNISSTHVQDSLKQHKYSTKGASKPLNLSQQPGSKKLLWVEHSQERYNETILGKTVLHEQRFRRTKTYISRNIRKDETIDEGNLGTYFGSLPWEKQKLFPLEDPQKKVTEHTLPLVAQRHLLDMFAESLLHVNRLFNSEYGYQARRVPAHMPHFINKGIMERLQEK